MQLFVKVTALKADTAEATAEGEVLRCPADVEPDTILSFLTQNFGEVVETAWTSTERHPRLACGWIFADTSERRDRQGLLCIPLTSTSDGSLQPMFEMLADQRLEFDELARSGELDGETVIHLPHRPYGPAPVDADHVVNDGQLPSTSTEAAKTPAGLSGHHTQSPAKVVSTGGGHRHGAGRAGATEFPATWTDDQVIQNIMTVAKRPDRAVWQANHRWRVCGQLDGVDIIAIVLPDGQVMTAWPLPGGRGVQQNPAWSMNANEAQFAVSMKRLPSRFSDRMSADDTEALHMMACSGEWEEEIDLLIADLAATQQSVTGQERKYLLSLLTQMAMPVDLLDKVPVADR